MSKVYSSAAELIGKTPLLELTHIEEKYGLKAKVLAKLEYFNPAGSVKDRIAKAMIEDADKQAQAIMKEAEEEGLRMVDEMTKASEARTGDAVKGVLSFLEL